MGNGPADSWTKKWPATVAAVRAVAGVQLRYQTGLTGEDYVSRQAWREARLERCPLHRRGGCGFARHGTYARRWPRGARIARWYCPTAHCTFSLLPDCLAARLPGTLAEVEAVVAVVEAASSLEAAADVLRPDIELPGAIRWTRRRVQRVHAGLVVVRALLAPELTAIPATVTALRTRLALEPVLPVLRERVAAQLADVPAPLGLRPRLAGAGERRRHSQHPMGPDPPSGAA